MITTAQLKKFGVELGNHFNELKAEGTFSQVDQVEIEVSGDHRMAMCFAPLALKSRVIIIDKPEVVAKSFPAFWNEIMH